MAAHGRHLAVSQSNSRLISVFTLVFALSNISPIIIHMNHPFRRGQGIGKAPYWLPGHGRASQCAQGSTD